MYSFQFKLGMTFNRKTTFSEGTLNRGLFCSKFGTMQNKDTNNRVLSVWNCMVAVISLHVILK